MTKIKAINTEYNGYKFRSRLEARWAVFFDAIGVPYEYESKSFEFEDGTRYLPDFYLPDSNQFFEVKGVMTDEDMHKIQSLISNGYVVTVGYNDGKVHTCDDWGESRYDFNDVDENNVSLVHCKECGAWSFLGMNGYWGCPNCHAYDKRNQYDIFYYEWDIKEYWQIAKQARFEWGDAITKEKARNLFEELDYKKRR